MQSVMPDGPVPARVMIVGEAPGSEEVRQGKPFVDASGFELNRMLQEAGISRSECFVTNVCRVQPPRNDISLFIAEKKKDRTSDHHLLRDRYVLRPIVDGVELLRREVAMVQPNIVIPVGNLAMWALTGTWGIMKWRGSMLYALEEFSRVKVIPTIHPAAVLRQWDLRAIAVSDLRRAARFRGGEAYPSKAWNGVVRPATQTAVRALQGLVEIMERRTDPFYISFDLETRHGHIACAGISYEVRGSLAHDTAICIPFMCVENISGYWSEDEEVLVTYWLRRVLTHPQARVVGQNLLYDSQYTLRYWGFVPNVDQDTMISHHSAFAGLRKSLDFQASMYCDHYVYWKDDGKEWDRSMGEDQLWKYNIEDCVRTAEVAAVTRETIGKLGLAPVDDFQQRLFWPVLQAMARGVRIDPKLRSKMAMELTDAMAEREAYFIKVLGHPLNPRSSKQMQALFYEDLKLPVQRSRATGMPTLDDKALDKLANKEPLVKPLLKAIQEYRSVGVFLSTFVQAPLDADGRMRCSYNICGTETYRFSSRENAFGSGTNLQNLPKGHEAKEPEDLSLPNVRKMFVPDPGYTFFDMDLDRADLQVVAWEADEPDLKKALKLGVDLHCMNAMMIFKIPGIPVEELVEKHPNYKDHRGRITEARRQKAKQGCHAVNYFCQARTLAMHLGSTVREAEAFIAAHLGANPGIKKWHDRTQAQLLKFRFVENRYGYRRYYFDRVEGLLPEALAWVPQSTVANTINRIWMEFYLHLPEVQVLLQVHDSIAGQFPSNRSDSLLPRMRDLARVAVPYPDPLIIPAGIKTSTVSWGDCA